MLNPPQTVYILGCWVEGSYWAIILLTFASGAPPSFPMMWITAGNLPGALTCTPCKCGQLTLKGDRMLLCFDLRWMVTKHLSQGSSESPSRMQHWSSTVAKASLCPPSPLSLTPASEDHFPRKLPEDTET